MPGPVTIERYDQALEEHGLRKQGVLGRGGNMGNALYSIDYDCLPPEARRTISLIVSDGPFPFPGKDGSSFGNQFGDLPSGRYREYTVITPGIVNRGTRRIVARATNGMLFFTACHYERVGVQGGTADERTQARIDMTKKVDPEWRNGFYIVTGMPPSLRDEVARAIKAKS
jgi:ribonuclease T1